MKVTVVCKEYSDHARIVDEWRNEFERRTGRTVEKIEPESLEGESFCRARGIMEYPTIIVEADDGKVLEQWSGRELPTIDTVMSYATS